MVYKTLKGVGTTFIYKDGFGAGNSATQDAIANNVVIDPDTFVGNKNNKETYIGDKDKEKLAMNKIQHTKVGDDIHYYMNGVEGRGIVVKMSNEYVLVAKEDGDFQDIHISDTFFVKDIVLNKTWDMMDSNERTEMLVKAHAPSARFVTKDWYSLPRELRDVLTKFTGSTSEAGVSRDDETKTHRDRDQSLAANNPTTDDEQSNGLKRDEKVASDVDKGYGDEFKEGGFKQQQAKKKKPKGKKCVSCGKVHKGDWKEKDSITGEQSKEGKPATGHWADWACETCGMEGHGREDFEHHELTHGGKKTGRRGHQVEGGKFTPYDPQSRSPAMVERSDVEHGAYGAAGGSPNAGVSTQAAFDIDEDTGYEERPHICEDCVGKLPRSDAKGHHENEIEEDKNEKSLKEQFDKVKEKEKSEQFRKIYGGGKKKKKGVPEWNVNSWGINYTVKEDDYNFWDEMDKEDKKIKEEEEN
jgi:hypothetical protein